MVSAEALSRLLYTLYAAPTSPELWPQFLQEFVRLVGVSGAGIVYHDTNQERACLNAIVGLDPVANSLYESYYCKKDEWTIAALRDPSKVHDLVFGDELCPRQQLRKTEFYNDFLLRFDTHFLCGIETLKTDTQLETVSLFQGVHDPEPDSDKINLILLVLPHIQAALRTRQQLVAAETKNREFEEALNCLAQGIALLDRSGNCVFVNTAAQRIVDQREGLSLSKSRFWVVSPTERASLNAIIHQSCTDGFTGGTVAISRHGKSSLRVSVHPFRSENLTSARRAVAIAFICDPEQNAKTSLAVIVSLYGLTPAEYRLAELLMKGLSLSEAAEQNQVSRETVRAQLKSIFNKTGARRQAELVCLFASALPG